ncbi:ADP-ribose glycohydrolase MACROD1 isoform X7 [Siniperca chuatsi]|uniref:ADP-ribose glycohydrolase MACROD1 isoform X7 n=1 Tax=Siniperca chuatsi TaxID=119488 RepID=UPI001CE1F2C3|nr:ADP-ribose glycohydrolase MACROD1 isoform X7 [Siniperca chuatsi]
MALQISALVSYIRAPLHTGPLSRVRANFQGAGVKFKHILSPGSPQLGGKPATSSLCGHFNVAVRAKKFSTTTTAALWKSSQGNGSSSPRGRRGWLGKVALGAVLGVSTVALVQSLHTGTLTAMALKLNLNSAEGDWKETKDFLLSLSVKDRSLYYMTSSVPLDDIPMWTPTAGASEQTLYQRNEKLDHKISLYSGDITKLEIDAIVNAANKTLLGGGGDVIHTVGPIAQGGVGEEEKKALRSCYKNSLITATKNAARSVAFPCISTGIYGYPPEQAVHEALATVREYLDEHHDKCWTESSSVCSCRRIRSCICRTSRSTSLLRPVSRVNSESGFVRFGCCGYTPLHSTSRFLLLLAVIRDQDLLQQEDNT